MSKNNEKIQIEHLLLTFDQHPQTNEYLILYLILNKKNLRLISDFFYSNLNASIGFIFAAFQAGNNQNITPIPIETKLEKIITFKLNFAGIGEYLFIR